MTTIRNVSKSYKGSKTDGSGRKGACHSLLRPGSQTDIRVGLDKELYKFSLGPLQSQMDTHMYMKAYTMHTDRQ